MIPCPKLPIFTYGALKTPQKLLVLAGKIEGSMQGRLHGFKIQDSESIIASDNGEDSVAGEILWNNLNQYDELIQALDNYGKASTKSQMDYHRFLCRPLTDEPIYNGIPPTEIECWSYKTIL